MKSKKITIRAKIKSLYCQDFGTWKWSDNDYKNPLIFTIGNVKAKLYLDKGLGSISGKRGDLGIFPGEHIEIEYPEPSTNFIRGLNNSGALSLETAKKIYCIYKKMMFQFEALCRTVGGMKNLIDTRLSPFEDFFEADSAWDLNKSPVIWWFEGEKPKEFRPKIPTRRKGKNPLFKIDQLLTKKKWNEMQAAIDNRNLPQEDIVEILRIQSRLFYGQRKTATLESSILLETILREHSYNILKKKGISKGKIKNLKDELTFNNILNLLLPLSLTKSQLKTLKESISSVDILRKIRNDIAHGNISEKEIDESLVKKGIERGLRLVKFLIKQELYSGSSSNKG